MIEQNLVQPALASHWWVWCRLTIPFSLVGERDQCNWHHRRRNTGSGFSHTHATRGFAGWNITQQHLSTCLNSAWQGKPIGSDVLVPTEGVETSCGHLILNTAGLENGKCQDLSHVCMGWEMCVCMDLAFLCLVMFFEIMRGVWHHLASHLVHMVQNNSKVLFPWQYLLDDDNPRSPLFSCYKCYMRFRDFSKFKKLVKYLYSCCL